MAIDDHSTVHSYAIDSGAVDNVTHPTDMPKCINIEANNTTTATVTHHVESLFAMAGLWQHLYTRMYMP